MRRSGPGTQASSGHLVFAHDAYRVSHCTVLVGPTFLFKYVLLKMHLGAGNVPSAPLDRLLRTQITS